MAPSLIDGQGTPLERLMSGIEAEALRFAEPRSGAN
jgi:hypothetical protein